MKSSLFLLVWLLLPAACGHAAPPPAPPPPAPAKAPTPAPRLYEPTTLPDGGGPIPASAWEPGRPYWLDGELTFFMMGRLDNTPEDADFAREQNLVRGTRTMATADRFSWGSHVCTAPTYEQRVISLQMYRDEHNLPTPPILHPILRWEVRITCAPGKGDIGLSLSRNIELDSQKLDTKIFFRTDRYSGAFLALKEKKIVPVLPRPEPGARLASGEGPLPGRTWEPGRPAWFDGDLVTDVVLYRRESDMENKTVSREREALLKEHLVISESRIAYAGRLCTKPSFEQQLLSKSEGEQVWMVRITCPKGNGDLALVFERIIRRGRIGDSMSAELPDLHAFFKPPKGSAWTTSPP